MAKEDSREEEMKSKYMELQMLAKQIKQIEAHLEALDAQRHELVVMKDGLDSIRNFRPGTEMMVHVNSGIFVNAELKDTENVIINVGAQTAVKKPITEAKKMIDVQLKNIEKTQKEMVNDIQTMASQANKLEKELSSLASQGQA